MRYKQLFFAAAILAAPTAFGITATKEYVDRKDGEIAALSTNIVRTATNAVLDAARGYTDTAISQIPPPDFSTNNAELVETIEATAPAPGDYAVVSNAAVHAAITNALQDVAIESNRVNIASHRVAISTLSDTKFDKSGGTVMGGIYFGAQGAYGYLGLEYDGENHRLIIADGWHENLAYLEVPNAYDGDRVAFTRDIDAAISGKQDNLPYPTNAIPYAAISGKPNLATVATSGSYNDLSNIPDVPSLAGHTYDFATNIGLYTAVRDLIQALGGSVTNFPAIPQN